MTCERMQSNPVKDLKQKGLWDADQFPHKEWPSDSKQVVRAWDDMRKNFFKTKQEPQKVANFQLNMIDSLRPFVNKRGVRQNPFVGEEHEVKLVQVDFIPGDAKLVYRNHELQIGEMVPVKLTSKQTILEDASRVSKKLFKKSKKAIREVI